MYILHVYKNKTFGNINYFLNDKSFNKQEVRLQTSGNEILWNCFNFYKDYSVGMEL